MSEQTTCGGALPTRQGADDFAFLGEIRDAAAILGVVVAVACVETWTERRAGRAIAALAKLSAPKALVWRDDSLIELASEDLVVDDVILLSAGCRVPADARLVEAGDVLVEESIVTGESQPVGSPAAHAELMSGTYVLRGRGMAQVTTVGASSTLGRIASLVAETDRQKTPLQKHMGELAKGLLVAALVVSAIVPLIGVLRGQPLHQMVSAAIRRRTMAPRCANRRAPSPSTMTTRIGSSSGDDSDLHRQDRDVD